jgi:hypothetical protein
VGFFSSWLCFFRLYSSARRDQNDERSIYRDAGNDGEIISLTVGKRSRFCSVEAQESTQKKEEGGVGGKKRERKMVVLLRSVVKRIVEWRKRVVQDEVG